MTAAPSATKRCGRCSAVKPLDVFARRNRAPEERQSWCKSCTLLYKAQRRAAAKRVAAPPPGMKRCSKCAVLKSLEYFQPRRTHSTGREPWCRACVSTQRRDVYHLNRETRLAQIKAYADLHREESAVYHRERRQRLRDVLAKQDRLYYEAHREQAAEYGRQRRALFPEKIRLAHLARTHRRRSAEGSFTADEWKALCNLYENRCLACGRDDVGLTVDHVVPLAKGGTNWITNLQPLCRPCNSKKHLRATDYRKPPQP